MTKHRSDNLQLIQTSDFILPNGLKVIVAPDKSNPIVSIQFYVKTGSTNETQNCRGFSHLLEHLTFKTTTNFPANQISEIIPRLGGVINAYTEFDTTCYYMMLPAEHLRKGLEIIADIAFRADFSAEDIAVEKSIIIEEIKQYDNEPESGFIDWIQNTYFVQNPLKMPILGTKESIKTATHSGCREFYARHYRPDNCFLVLSGSFEKDKVQKDTQELFNQWHNPKTHKPSTEINKSPECNGFALISRIRKAESDYLAFVMPELVETDVNSDAMLLLMKAFAADKQSRLYKRLVEKDKSALGIRLHSISGKYPGITIIQIIPASTEVIADIVYAFYDEFYKIKHMFLTADEIELIKREMYYSWLFDFEYIESIGSSLASEEIISSYHDLYKFPQRINNISAEMLTASLNTYWLPDFIKIYYQGQRALNNSLKYNIIKLFKSESQPSCLEIKVPQLLIGDEIINMPDLNEHYTNSQTNTTDDFKLTRLDNGMQLIMRKVLNKPTISVAVTNSVSQLCEDINNRGINYFTSILLLYGTQNKTFDELQKESLRHGYSIKINHTLETTTLKGKCFYFSFNKMLETIADILQSPRLPAKYLNIVKTGTIDNIRREKDSPFNYSYNKWIKQFLGKDTNLNKSYGNISQTKLVTLDAVRNWFESNYCSSDFSLCVVGDIDFSAVQDICNNLFINKSNDLHRNTEAYIYQSATQHTRIKHTDSDQSNIIVGGRGSSAGDFVSNTGFYVLSQILGGDLSSRFFNILREKYGYAYQTGFDFTSIRDFGYWFAYVICDKGDNRKVLALLDSILSDICRNGVTKDELYSAKNYLLGLNRFDMESLGWQANSLSILYALGYDYDYWLGREQRIQNIDLDIIQSLARKWINPDSMYTYFES